MQNYYQMFKLSPSITQADLRKWILGQIRFWNVKTNSPSAERRKEAEQVLQLLTQMEGQLLDPILRLEYDQQLLEEEAKNPSNETFVEGKEEVDELADALQIAQQHLENRKYLLALEELIPYTHTYSGSAAMWFLYGKALFHLEQYSKAVSALVKASDLDPSDATVVWWLGQTLRESGKIFESEEKCHHALDLAPQNLIWRYDLAEYYLSKQKYRQAIELLEECWEQKPEESLYQEKLVSTYITFARYSWKRVPEDHEYLPEGVYPLAHADLRIAELYLKRAKRIKIQNESLQKEIEMLQKEIKGYYGREFTGSWTFLVFSLLDLIFITYQVPSYLNVGFLVFLPMLYFFSARSIKFRVTSRLYFGNSGKTDVSYVWETLHERSIWLSYILTLVFLVLYHFILPLFLSFVILYNFYKRYWHPTKARA
ncbi:tetratricopeptide repeat protein [Risungbinella massiliensis]|uniref:tetratricopeptide repeat protein n=1 Tax=Risungbinella massiliensis TaxID=1329796 RepID=UPI0005CBD61F|nr:tetratricopeptide repeat protein [Risungbinella massiliensis]